jgi:predicted Zn-ribbon and HTH transcriptional regulator
MSIKQEIQRRLGRGTVSECENCGLEYDSDRLNCPACGFTVRET